MTLNKLLLAVVAFCSVCPLFAQPVTSAAPAARTTQPAAQAASAGPLADLKPEPVPVQLHPWQAALPRLIAEAYFTNIKDGDTIETPYLLKFGLSGGWGLAPISKPVGGKAGHHHLLINKDLPLDFKTALPFTDQYVHFGKGQMESVLNLPPGTYKLRLLLADDKHLPHFVYSKPTTITVSKKNTADPKTLVKKGIEMWLPVAANGEQKRPFRVQFHASGLNVAHQGQAEKDTGHFRLTMLSEKGIKAAEMDFVNGQTEVWLEPPAGAYTLQLDLMDNLKPGSVLASTAGISVKVR